MKIISKYKDYYDYLTGIYGIDDKIILDRRVHRKYEPRPVYTVSAQSLSHMTLIQLHFCDVVYEGVLYDGKIYWTENVLTLPHNPNPFPYIGSRGYRPIGLDDKPVKFVYIEKAPSGVSFRENVYLYPYKTIDNLNRRANCPIIIYEGRSHFHNDPFEYETLRLYKYPKLAGLDVKSIIPAEQAFIRLSEWLSPKEPESKPLTDKEKVISHGMDPKTSFRPKIKNK
jgi:hypothetical protein